MFSARVVGGMAITSPSSSDFVSLFPSKIRLKQPQAPLGPNTFPTSSPLFFAPAIISSSSLDCFPLIRLIWRPFFQNNNPGMNEAVQILQPKTMPFHPRLKFPVGLLGRFWQILKEQQPRIMAPIFLQCQTPMSKNLRCFMVILLMDKSPKQWSWLVNGIFTISTGFLAGFLNHQQYPLISDIPWDIPWPPPLCLEGSQP